MPITIFHCETNAYEEWLLIEDDGTATYHVENSDWPMMRAGGVNCRERKMTAAQAKSRWPNRADMIDAALLRIRAAREEPGKEPR